MIFRQMLIIACGAVGALQADDGTVNPVRVCDVLHDLPAYEGKVAAIVGRYSFRLNGRYLSEDGCESSKSHEPHHPQILPIAFDAKLAPKTPDHLEIDAGLVQKLLKTIQVQTSLAKFRFGTPEYDRWAVVYGRVETVPGKTNSPLLMCVGESVIMFIVDRY